MEPLSTPGNFFWYFRGLYYQEKKHYDESIQSYLKAIEFRPKLTGEVLRLGSENQDLETSTMPKQAKS